MKLSLDALKERAEATASMDLLATISGGTDNACHDDEVPALNDDFGLFIDNTIKWIKSWFN